MLHREKQPGWGFTAWVLAPTPTPLLTSWMALGKLPDLLRSESSSIGVALLMARAVARVTRNSPGNGPQKHLRTLGAAASLPERLPLAPAVSPLCPLWLGARWRHWASRRRLHTLWPGLNSGEEEEERVLSLWAWPGAESKLRPAEGLIHLN